MDVSTQTRNITINNCKYVQIGGKNKQSTEKWNNDVIDGDDSDESDDASCNKPGNDRLSKLNEREKELLEKLEACLKKMGLITEELNKVRFIRNNILAPQNLPDRGDENIREMNTSSAGADLREMENKETESKIDNDLQEKDESFDLKGSDRNTVGEHTLESSDEDELDSTRQDGADRQLDDDDRQKDADRQKEEDADRQLDSDNRQNDADRQKEDIQEKKKDAERQEKKKDAGKRKEVNRKNIHRPI